MPEAHRPRTGALLAALLEWVRQGCPEGHELAGEQDDERKPGKGSRLTRPNLTDD
jgi:hypothetical protein